jgi:hypothetical protein
MALKNFDAKQFLLEKGERVGLYVAAGLMALLLVLGLKNVFTSSAGANEKALKDLVVQKRQMISSSTPTAEEFKEIATPDRQLERAMEFTPVAAEKYPNTVAFFEGEAAAENLRRAPRIKTPVEFMAAVARAQVDTYRLSGDREHILVLRGAGTTDKNTMKANQKVYNFFSGAGKRMAMMAGPMGGGSGGPMSAGPMGGGGGSGMMRPAGGGGSGMAGPRQPGLMDQSDPDTKRNAQMVNISDLEKMQDARPAEDIRPVRMAIIVGSFPYKEQLEEFRQTLHFNSLPELLSDPYSTPQFKGCEVERAEVKPGDTEDKLVFKPLGLADFTQLALDTGRNWEDDAVELDPVIVDGLTMQRPKQMRKDQYPDVETKLKHIEDTLADLKKARQGTIAKPKNRFKDAEGLDVFSRGDSSAAGGEGAPPGMQPGAAGDSARGMRPMGLGPMGNGEGAGYDPNGQLVVPEYLLMRYLDVTVEPGKAYRYRVRIRVANPNFGRKDVAWAALAADKELKSDWVMVDKAVEVPPELYYYAIDLKTQGDKDQQKALWNAPNPGPNQVPVQSHRWVENVYPDPARPRDGFAVGDWCIAERMLVTRGESLGRTDKVEVPIWDVLSERFSLASLTVSGRKTKQKVPVFFGAEGQPDSVLVDFQGGLLDYNKFAGMDEDKPKYTLVHDRAPVELVVMSADGKLSAHRGDADMSDDDRKARVETWQKRIDEIKDADKAKVNTQQGTPMNPFNINKGS